MTPPASCSEFIPQSWRVGVSGAPLPVDDTLLEWQKFSVAQSGQLEKANGRLTDTIHIVSTCERRQNDARPRRKVLGIF